MCLIIFFPDVGELVLSNYCKNLQKLQKLCPLYVLAKAETTVSFFR